MALFDPDAIDPYADKDVHWLIRSQAERHRDAPFLLWEPFSGPGETWTYASFYSEVRNVAAGLRDRGIGHGDFLLLHANNCPEFLLTWYACALLGAVVVTTNPRAAVGEMTYFIEHSGVKAAVVEQSYLDLMAETGAGFAWMAAIATPETEGTALPDGVLPFASLSGDGAALELEPLDPMTRISVQYTSGTTSRPKGVVWTHANVLWGAQVGAAHNQLRSDDCAIVFTPLCHTNAMSWGHFPIVWSGSRMVLQPKFSASRFWPLAVEHKCTWGNVIPFAMQAVIAQGIPEQHSYRHWVVGAANIGDLESHLKLSIVGAWGMTETVTHGTWTPPQLPAPMRSMGMPAPEYEIRIVDDAGLPVAKGQTGNLKIRGKRGRALFLEYLNNPEATAASFDADGWFDTGDRVWQSEHGHLRFADRAKDMLKVGAENVAASEIESVIALVPGVGEVAVVGRPHPMLDEVPVAFVISPNPGPELAEAILAKCRHELAGFKVPVEVLFMDEFPRAELNKVAKKELREIARSEAAAVANA